VGSSFSPLDEQLGLLPGRFSPRLQQIVSLLGTLMPFGQVPALLALVSGVTLSRSSVRRITATAGTALAIVEQAEVAQLQATLPPCPPGPARQQVSVDGAMVPIVGGEWREVKTLAIGDLDADGADRAGAWSYRSRIGEADRFAELATGELHRRGTFAAKTVVGVADGAIWCQQFYAYHLPNAIRILDFPHAAGHLSRAAQACFGPGEAADDWSRIQRAQLLAGQVEAVCQAVTELPVTQASNPSEAYTVMRQVVSYLRERVAQLAYADFVVAGYPIGSGAVESANKRVVEARLKGAGMHWTVATANALLALRGALCSQRWDVCWNTLSTQRRQAARRSRPRCAPPAAPPPPTSVPAKPTLTRHHLAKITTPNPYFTDGKPNATHPYKRDYERKYGTTTRVPSRPSTEI
jgi:hypothetical protein